MTATPHAPRAPGILLRSPRVYDFQVWLAMHGRERPLREALLRLAKPGPGEAMLDVGCGTGTLAIAAWPHLRPGGQIVGVDASPEMIAGARRKARKARVECDFREAQAQALPFPNARFDLVTSTLMLHHLPGAAREACVREIRRVLKPEGRVLIVDFASSSQQQGGLFHRLHRHGRVRPADIRELVTGAGLSVADTGPLPMRDLHYVLAAAPGTAS